MEALVGEVIVIDYASASSVVPLTGDTEVYLWHKSVKGKKDRMVGRFKFNTAFIHKKARLQGMVFSKMHVDFDVNQMDPHQLAKDHRYKDLTI